MTKNKNYREFMDTGIMKTISAEQLAVALDKIKGIRGKHIKEGRALLTVLYYTGARPAEAFKMTNESVSRDKGYVVFKVPGVKNSKTRIMYVSIRRPFVKECYEFCRTRFPGILLFFNYRGRYVRTHMTKKGEIKKYVETSAKLRKYLPKWFEEVIEGSINPYFLRHNRFSKLSMSGASATDIMNSKGGSSLRSSTQYIHMNQKKAKQIARMNH